MHLYISEPVNAYKYYYKRGVAKRPIYREIPWSLKIDELQDLTVDENSPYLVFYLPNKYVNVIEDLRSKGQLIHNFIYKNYGVALVKPNFTGHNLIKLNYTNFESNCVFNEDNTVAIWNGDVKSKEIRLVPGKYSITVISRGTPVNEIYPKNTLFLNDQKLGAFIAKKTFAKDVFLCTIRKDSTYKIGVKLDNDEQTMDEDRNTFLKAIIISLEKKKEPSLR